jgi:hypothetical protein
MSCGYGLAAIFTIIACRGKADGFLDFGMRPPAND